MHFGLDSLGFHPLSRCALLAVVLLASACANINNYYSPADQQGPPVDVSGSWYFTDGRGLPVVKVVPTGSHARVIVKSTGASSEQYELDGEIQGRVLLAHSRLMECALTVAPEGRQARVGFAGGAWSGTEGVAHRLVLGKSGDRDAARADPLLGGGLVCQLPAPGGSTREVLVFLEYRPKGTGGVSATRTFITLENPPRVWKAPYPGDGLFAHVLDRGVLVEARAGSTLKGKQSVTLDGKPGWLVLSPGWNEREPNVRPARLLAEFYRNDPETGALPEEVVDVAERGPAGEWRPAPHYLLSSSTLTQAQAVLEGGRPVRIELVQPAEPALDEFLVLEEKVIPQARWRNRALLEVKNRTLPKILRDLKTSELTSLATRLEKFVLDLNHESELQRDRAQKSVENSTVSAGEIREDKREIAQIRTQLADPNLEEGISDRLRARLRELEISVARLERERGDSQSGVDDLREMSTVYKERVELLKPFLAAIKEEIGNRSK